ncbi:MAG: agmatinase [Pseudomonadota bacterium]|nr:agmatinase [Pseudomonadota bacterium]
MGHEMPYSGALSLFRRNYSRNLDGADIAVSGVTFDLATANRPGTRFGPRGIREASTNLAWEGGPWPWDLDPFATLAVVDCGDCAFDNGYPDQIPAAIEKHADNILETGTAMVTMGGDHFITYPLLKAHHKVHGPLSLVHFDAHSDTWREDDERIDHGTMFFHAARFGLVDPARSVQIGLRTLNSETHGFHILDADFVHENGPRTVAERVCDIVGDNKAYLTFDIDCLDPAFAPGTGTPVCGGLSTWQAQTIIRGLTAIDFVSMDLVEVAPAYDVGDVTSLAGASLLLDYFCLLASRCK